MRKLVYDVAVSLDGYIAAENGDAGAFLQEGDHVDAYWQRMAAYDTVIMGRHTYEYGYAHGMKPGDRAYPNMRHYILSTGLEAPQDQIIIVRENQLETVAALKAEEGGDIYLCGGGSVAGALLDAGLIDKLILKLNPIVIGAGIPLFAGVTTANLRLTNTTPYASGVVLLTYEFGV